MAELAHQKLIMSQSGTQSLPVVGILLPFLRRI